MSIACFLVMVVIFTLLGNAASAQSSASPASAGTPPATNASTTTKKTTSPPATERVDRACEASSDDYGVAFWTDEKKNARHYICHRASSPNDFNGLPLRSYHKSVIQWFVSQKDTAYTGLLQNGVIRSNDVCGHLSFSTVPPND